MRGKGGWSDVHHYEVSGAGRVNYQFHTAYTQGASGDPHRVVRIVDIDLSSH
jgi:hypothetical protein